MNAASKKKVLWEGQLRNDVPIRELYQKLVEEVRDYAVLFLDPEGTIEIWNIGVERVSGYTGQEVVGRNFRCFFSSEDQRAGLPERFLELAKTKGRIEQEVLQVRKDGSTFWATLTIDALHDSHGRIIGFTKLTRDLTEPKRAAQLRGLLDAAPDPIVVINRSGEIVHVNVQTELDFGYKRQELLGRGIEILVPERFRTLHSGHLINYFNQPRRRSMSFAMELFACRKDGSEFPVEISLSPIHADDEILVSSAIRDVSERKVAENLHRMGRELEIRNQELERFAYLASHDLQEPLQTIANFTQMLADQYRDRLDQEALRAFDFVTEAVDRMRILITDLLDHSRIGQGSKIEEIDCNELLQAVLDNLSVSVQRENAHVEIAKLPTLKGQRTELQLLFQNLIGNSIKFHKPDIPPQISVSAQAMTDAWQFRVQDNGIGIDLAYKEKIFELFQRLHRRKEYDGTGIGLAHCKKIVKLHNGEIWVDSVPGKGCTFYFTIRQITE